MKPNKNTTRDIRKLMFHEMIEKNIFNQVKEYAFDYADNSLNRNVFPTKEALEKLQIFMKNCQSILQIHPKY